MTNPPPHTTHTTKHGTDMPDQSQHPSFRYTAQLARDIETRWQQYWSESNTFRQPNPGDSDFDVNKPKFYCLDMYPYPSGAGLHVGHPEGYTATDIVSRYKKLTGHNVLHPMGWDAFGLPAEQYAITTGVHPAITTKNAIETFKRQLQRFGFSYDWNREVSTIDPDYYRWTQWIWLKAYHAWYDTNQDRARHVDELINELEAGTICVGCEDAIVHTSNEESSADDVRSWRDLDPQEQRRFIDNHRLAYLDEQMVNWCPKLGTALANEEVIDGKSERGQHPVYRKPLKQWMFRITAYADRLLNDLADLEWPESTLAMQREWIGRSEGAEVDFPLAEAPDDPTKTLRVYTTRPDTLFGATFMVVAPEHPLIEDVLKNPRQETDVDALRTYVEQARHRSDLDRMAESKEKTGVFTGIYAINPVNNSNIPIWTADYVLMGYGHGAIMAVPAHDQRDHDFARAFDLLITQVITGGEVDIRDEAWAGDGVSINSANTENGIDINNLPTEQAKEKITAWLEEKNIGKAKVNYKLRDWLFSRQRYWGEPFPIVFDQNGNHYAVDEEHLPVLLPEMEDYHPIESDDPQPLLAKATDWVHTTAGEAGVSPDVLDPAETVIRETNTMPGWAGSCWYYLRFCDPRNNDRLAGQDAERYWMTGAVDDKQATSAGVDLYIGGAEHSVLHLLYARFWHKMLYDLGEISTSEPFIRLFHQGLITSFAYQRADKSLVPTDDVEEIGEDKFVEKANGKPVTQVTAKMSKSLKNVINPDDIIHDFGADTFRLYEMYMGPLEATKPWNTRDIVGVYRFLQRVWRLVINEETGELMLQDQHDDQLERALHRTIAKVGSDIDRLAMNTAIAAMIEWTNQAIKVGRLTADQLERFAIILSPFAPHIAEELWSKLGHESSITQATWPTVDETMLQDETIELPVQIKGKVRSRINVAPDADQKTIEEEALKDPRIQELIADKAVRKVIVVPGQIVNIIV